MRTAAIVCLAPCADTPRVASAENLEIASLPTTTPEERARLLSFVISGGGPTGTETAAELSDMLNEDVLGYFPKLLRSQAKVHLIQSREHILNTYSEKISEFAEKRFANDDVEIITNARVKRVEPDKVVYSEWPSGQQSAGQEADTARSQEEQGRRTGRVRGECRTGSSRCAAAPWC